MNKMKLFMKYSNRQVKSDVNTPQKASFYL